MWSYDVTVEDCVAGERFSRAHDPRSSLAPVVRRTRRVMLYGAIPSTVALLLLAIAGANGAWPLLFGAILGVGLLVFGMSARTSTEMGHYAFRALVDLKMTHVDISVQEDGLVCDMRGVSTRCNWSILQDVKQTPAGIFIVFEGGTFLLPTRVLGAGAKQIFDQLYLRLGTRGGAPPGPQSR